MIEMIPLIELSTLYGSIFTSISIYEYGEDILIFKDNSNHKKHRIVEIISEDPKNRNAMLFEYIEQLLTFKDATVEHIEDREVLTEWLNRELEDDADNYPLIEKALKER